jgi:5'-nucleotidase (lipoprotein e(P4) family)
MAPRAAAPKPDSIRWVREAAEYQAAVLQTYRAATAHVEAEARARAAGSWAVVLDADETIISNLAYQEERARLGRGFTPESWNAWVRRREATPLPGAAAFLARVRALGGRIAVVTNRLQSECDDTAAVFTRHQLPYDALLCRPDAGPSDKNPRFEAVAAGQTPAGASRLEVVAFLGDNIQDFPRLTQAVAKQGEAELAMFGTRFFVVPNPMYGSWQ